MQTYISAQIIEARRVMSAMLDDVTLLYSLQAAKQANVGTRCHYLVDEQNNNAICDAATHKISSLQESIVLLEKTPLVN